MMKENKVLALLATPWVMWLIFSLWDLIIHRGEFCFFRIPSGLSDISSIATITSFGLFLPILVYQLLSEQDRTRKFEGYIRKELGELRKIDTDQGLQQLSQWVNPQGKYAPAVIYVSKHSVVPGFWLKGDDWCKNLKKRNSTSGEKLLFAGPHFNTNHFQEIAKIAIQIMNDPCHLRYSEVCSNFAGLNDIERIKCKYKDNVKRLEEGGGKVVWLCDNQLKSIGINFALNKIDNYLRYGSLSSWCTMFFDTSEILSGGILPQQSQDFQPKEVFLDPSIFESKNEVLGYMFRYFAYRICHNLNI
jgi:hypothetical protein